MTTNNPVTDRAREIAQIITDIPDLTARFWLIVREPGCVPDRKGPFIIADTAKVLREFMAANPTAFIDYLTVGPDGSPDVEHGPLVLQYTDGRSMSVGRKHNERVREALASKPTPASHTAPDALRASLDERIANYSALRDQCVETGTDENGYALAVEALEHVRHDVFALATPAPSRDEVERATKAIQAVWQDYGLPVGPDMFRKMATAALNKDSGDE